MAPRAATPHFPGLHGSTALRAGYRHGSALGAEGCSAHSDGPGPQWTSADRDSFRLWQRKLGDAPEYCDGWPGPRQWAALKVPAA
ncbi:peptidoglycan-binding protein [Streptomyces sp. NPDC001415]